jgi:tRNA pseudouridine55 synthase/H/ACA ribonucleoprotein complex subunit 4
MIELRRTKSGGFSCEESHTLHEIRDAVETGNTAAISAMILPPEKAIADIPKIIIRDKAAKSVANGAILAGVGAISIEKFSRGDKVALVTQSGQLIALAESLFDSDKIVCGKPGLIAKSTRVFVTPDSLS